ncbi:MAG: hypothetical protein ACI9R3_004489 [Verrucomicrobiales bacterium]|jgi:hypothetical protein
MVFTSLLVHIAQASVSITSSNVLEVRGETGEEIALGTLGLVVVDTGNDGFDRLSPGSISVGSLIGDGNDEQNDWVVHRIPYEAVFNLKVFSLGRGGLTFGLDVSTPSGLAKSGNEIALYWFPGLGLDDQAINEDQLYGMVRGNDWVVPGDGASVSFDSITGTSNADIKVRSGSEGNRFLQDPFGDPDGDQIPNLFEIAFGGDPEFRSSPDILPSVYIVEENGLRFAYVQFRQIKDISGEDGSGSIGVDYEIAGLRYVVEVSDDLQTWKVGESHSQQIGELIDNEDGTVTVTVRLANEQVTSRMLFGRVRVEIVE